MNIAVLLLKLLLNAGLLYIVAATSFTEDTQIPENIEYHLPANVQTEHYDIKLSMRDAGQIIIVKGESNVTIDVRNETSSISLHMQQISFLDIILINKTDVKLRPLGYDYNSYSYIMTINFDRMLPTGSYTLYMKFISHLFEYEKENNLTTSYVNKKGRKILQILTISRPYWVRRLFPCWDEPLFHATFNISVKHSEDYFALSNSPILSRRKEKNGMIWTRFYKTVPMPTYRLAILIAISNIVRICNSDDTIYIWCQPEFFTEISFALDVAETLKSKLNWYTRSHYEMRKISLFALTDFTDKIIGSWGITLHRQTDIVYDAEIDSLMKKIAVARLVARITAYQWLDNIIYPQWWSDLWFTEGAAIFFQVNALEKIFPEWQMSDLFVVQTVHEALHFDVNYHMMPLTWNVTSPSDIETVLSLAYYIKAPVIFRMLQHIVTDVKNNPDAMYKYFATSQFISWRTPHDWNVMQESLDTSKRNTYKLSSVMNTWTMQQMYPMLQVIRNYTTGQVIIYQTNIITLNKAKWWIPLTYTSQEKPNFLDTTPRIWLKPHVNLFTLDELYQKEQWIIFNLQQTGYYRVNYDDHNWDLIANSLNEDHKKIHVLNRAQLINDAYYFLMNEQLPLSLFLKLTQYLSKETDYIAWYPMIKAAESLSSFIPYKGSERIKNHIQKIFNGVLSIIGFDEDRKNRDDILNCFRIEAIRMLCVFGDKDCTLQAHERLLMYAEDHNSLSPEWRFWAYCNGLDGEEERLWEIFGMPFEPKARKIIEFFHCPSISISDYHLYILNVRKIIKQKQKEISSSSNISMYYLVSYAKQNLTGTLEKIKYYNERFTCVTLTVIINYTYREDELDQINEFVEDYLQKKKKIEATSIQGKIKQRRSQIKRQMGRFAMWSTENVQTSLDNQRNGIGIY